MSSLKRSSTIEWEQPEFRIKDWGGYRYFPLKRQISLNADLKAPFDVLVAGIVHEINHWAHMYLLNEQELDKILDVHYMWFGAYDDQLLEKAAWWGTGFKGRGVRDDGSL